jgi:hypothetical protein
LREDHRDSHLPYNANDVFAQLAAGWFSQHDRLCIDSHMLSRLWLLRPEEARQMAAAYRHLLEPPHRLDWDFVTQRNLAICYDGKRQVAR